MTREQLTKLQQARELIKQALALLDSMKFNLYRESISIAAGLLFDSLVSHLNKVEHDAIHDGILE